MPYFSQINLAFRTNGSLLTPPEIGFTTYRIFILDLLFTIVSFVLDNHRGFKGQALFIFYLYRNDS